MARLFIHVIATAEFKEQVKAQADREGRSVGSYIRWLIDQDRKRQDKAK